MTDKCDDWDFRTKKHILSYTDQIAILRATLDEAEKALDGALEDLKTVKAFPTKGAPTRRTRDGYPAELCYDEFAYKRIVGTYREAMDRPIEKLSASLTRIRALKGTK